MLIEILKHLKDLPKLWATVGKDRRELKDNALRSLNTALRETKLYYHGLGKGKSRDRDIEAQLVKYCGAAAIPLRHFDEELAFMCEQKAEYWIDPEQWSDAQIRELGIELSEVSKSYRSLAMPSMSRMRDYKSAG